VGCVLASLGHSLALAKKFGGSVHTSQGSKKVDLGWYDLTRRSLKFLSQSSPDFFVECQSKRDPSCTCQILNIFILSRDIRCQSLKSFEIWPNYAHF